MPPPHSYVYQGRLTERPEDITLKRGCFQCVRWAVEHFDPNAGDIAHVDCNWGSPYTVACNVCVEARDRYEPIPGMMAFDQTRFNEMMAVAETLFQAIKNRNGVYITDDNDRLTYHTPYDVRVQLAGAQFRFMKVWRTVITQHREAHHLDLPINSRGAAAAAYEALMHERAIIARNSIQRPSPQAPMSEQRRWFRATSLRLMRHDEGMQGWQAGIICYFGELEDICTRNGMRPRFLEVMQTLNIDLLEF